MHRPGLEQRDGKGGSHDVPRELIGGLFSVDFGRPLSHLGAGVSAFGVHDRAGSRSELMALQVPRSATPRMHALAALSSIGIGGLATPLAHGTAPASDGSAAQFVVCLAPKGTALGGPETVSRRWTEAELIACVLRPVAAILAELAGRGVTHRAIRLDNVFQLAPGQPVTLGAAWAAPPASLLPAAFAPPYVASCLASGRGEGSIGDDIYALGVLLLALAAGAVPFAGVDAAEVVRSKLALGSYAALTAELRPPPVIADLASSMLAEDPDHRPSPASLSNPQAVRSRRLAVRPASQAQRPLVIEDQPVSNARALAMALAANPQAGVRALREGIVDQWLRRELTNSAAAVRVEDALRIRAADARGDQAQADAVLLVRAVAALDHLAPVCWEGVSLWPDGLGAALVAADGPLADVLARLVAAEAIATWGAARPDRCEPPLLRMEARRQHGLLVRRGWGGGIALLRYALSPLAACRSPLLSGRMVTRIGDLLPALEAAAGEAEHRPSLPMDAEIAAFLVAREELRGDPDLAELGAPSPGTTAPGAAAVAQTRILARLQTQQQAGPLPKLAAWLAAELIPALSVWQSRSRRTLMHDAMAERAAAGHLAGLMELIDAENLREQDRQEAEAARTAVGVIESVLADLHRTRQDRAGSGRRIGQEVAAATGVIALSCTAMWLLL